MTRQQQIDRRQARRSRERERLYPVTFPRPRN